MALIYRASWEESRSDLIQVAESAAGRWFKKKGINEKSTTDGVYEGNTVHPFFKNEYAYKVTIAHAESDGILAYRLRLAEYSDQIGHDFVTQYTALTGGGNVGTHWVDVDRTARDPYARFDFRIPSLVNDLIKNGRDARVGQVRLETGPKVIPVDGLVGLIKSPTRSLPIAVFSHDRTGKVVTLDRAKAAHERLRGIAQVFVLPAQDIGPLRELVGEELSVWGGGARLYMPNWGPGGLRPERHRYVPGMVAARWPGAAADIFAQILAGVVTATPEPTLYSGVRRALLVAEGETAADQIFSQAALEIEELQRELRELQDKLFDEQSENERLNSELNAKSGTLERVRRNFVLMQNGGAGLSDDGAIELPETVSSITEAILLADGLPGVVIHSDAPTEIDKLEVSLEATAWAQGIWRGLRSLDCYAREHTTGSGSFWEWCKRGDSAWSWPATDKKLSMSESSTVRGDRRFNTKRQLPVSTDVHPEGKIEMLTHLKIAEGGGDLAPRIYIFDDTAGTTKKVHVGYIGPHSNMPNTLTN